MPMRTEQHDLQRRVRELERTVEARDAEIERLDEKIRLMQDPGRRNLIDEIAHFCGWKPLENGEKMTVQFGGCEYVIQRTK